MARKIQVKRGLAANIPLLDMGEFAITTDTEKPFIGSTSGNVELAKQTILDAYKAENATVVNVLSEGVKGDGTDETILTQAAFDKAINNHGVFYIPSGVTVVVDQLKVTGKSNFKIVIDGTLKRKANASSFEKSGIGDVWGLLRIVQCTDFDIQTFHGDGNIAENPSSEGVDVNETQHIIHLSECDRVRLGTIVGINPGGDVLLIGYCYDILCDSLYGYGNYVGRQTLSIYDGERMQFGNIMSIGIGMRLMPGGIDLEPEANPWGDAPRIIKDIEFGNVYIDSMADGCFIVSNNFTEVTETNLSPATISNITVNNLICKRPYTISDGRGRVGVWLKHCDNIKIKGVIYEDHVGTVEEPISSTGLYIEGCNNLYLDLDIQNVFIGFKVGYFAVTNQLKLSGRIKDIAGHGFAIKDLTDSVIESQIEDCGKLGGDYWCGYFDYGGTLTKDVYFKNASFVRKTYGNVGINFTGANLRNVWFENCDFRGWDSTYIPFRNSGDFIARGSVVHRIGCKNINYASAMPTTSYWQAGEYVENTVPTIVGTAGSKYVVKGWKRITSNANNVLNTDWVEDRALTGS